MEETFGQRVKRLRLASGMTQPELAQQIGSATSQISAIEQDARQDGPAAFKMPALAQALGVSLDYLFLGRSTVIDTLVPVPLLDQRIPIGDSWPVEAEHIPLVKLNHGLVAIQVRGDCMAPRIVDGDVVIIDKDRLPELGKVIVFWWQGDWTLKRLRRRNGKWWMVPDNPAFEPIEIDGKDVEPLGVVIRVVKPEP